MNYVCKCVCMYMYMYSGEGSVQYNIHYNTNCTVSIPTNEQYIKTGHSLHVCIKKIKLPNLENKINTVKYLAFNTSVSHLLNSMSLIIVDTQHT